MKQMDTERGNEQLHQEQDVLSVQAAIYKMSSIFPLPDLLWRNHDAYLHMPTVVMKYLKPGARILDFGAGSCDKTAVFQLLGYQCTAYDDLCDTWHLADGNRDKILHFAESVGIKYYLAEDGWIPKDEEPFDAVMMQDVLEHLHDSPRDLLQKLLAIIKPGGYFIVTVPNAVNIRKRLDVAFGRTNLPPFEHYYWWPGPWRDHVREYVKDDLRKLARYLGIEEVELRGCDHMLHKVPRRLRRAYVLLTNIFDAWKDSLLLVAKRPADWQPMEKV